MEAPRPVTNSLRPTSELVAVGWLQLALPTVRSGTRLLAPDDDMRRHGYVRASITGGAPDMYTPRRAPVIVAECWVPPAQGSQLMPWNQAGELAEQVIAATNDRTLMGRFIDLSVTGDYQSAFVFTVVALGEPRRVESDPNNFARVELDLQFAWIPTA